MQTTVAAIRAFLLGDADELETIIESLSSTWEIDGPTKCKVALPGAEKFSDGWTADFKIELTGRDPDKLQQELLSTFVRSSLTCCMFQNVNVLKTDVKILTRIKENILEGSSK